MFAVGGQIVRTIAPPAWPRFEASREILAKLASEGRLVEFDERLPAEAGFSPAEAAAVLSHPRLEPWTQPYEWSFSLLKDAALFHLDLHLDLLEQGFTLADASAYNIQFVGPRPIFIDHLSIRPYVEGEFWTGHRQFCEQFLNPLLLRAYLDIAPNAWYRGSLEGIPVDAMARLVPFRRKLSWRVLSNVLLPARFQRSRTSDKQADFSLAGRKLPLGAFRGLLQQLRNWIGELIPADTSATTWAQYATTTTYDDVESAQKQDAVARFIQETRAATVIDLGCNTGEYSKLALASGAKRVTGFDFDQQSLDQAHARAKTENLAFLPLYLDAMNPSPTQGWMQAERAGFAERFTADAVLALAFEHHLAIAHNAPLEQVAAWIGGIANHGLIEFVPKEDPTVRKMLALREDIFVDYTLENFVSAMGRVGRVIRQDPVSASGRTMIWFAR